MINPDTSAIARAIKTVDGQKRLVQLLADEGETVTQQAVSLWKRRGYAPRAWWDAVAHATRGRVTAEELEADYQRVWG